MAVGEPSLKNGKIIQEYRYRSRDSIPSMLNLLILTPAGMLVLTQTRLPQVNRLGPCITPAPEPKITNAFLNYNSNLFVTRLRNQRK